jgi:hypothetical protein
VEGNYLPFPALEMGSFLGSIKLKMQAEYFLPISAKRILSETRLPFPFVDPNISEEKYRMIKGRLKFCKKNCQ